VTYYLFWSCIHNHPIYPEETESSEEKDKLDEGGAKQQPTTDSGIFPADTTSGTFHRV